MVESDLPLPQVGGMDFVRHHSGFCCVHPTNPGACPETGKYPDWQAARLLLRLMARRHAGANNHLVQPTTPGEVVITTGCEHIAAIATQWPGPATGTVAAGTPEGSALAYAIVSALAVDDVAQAQCLAYRFASKTEMFDALRAEVASFLGGVTPAHLKLDP